MIKKRLGLSRRGKHGCVRILVAFRREDKVFFIYGFAKNERANISARELTALKLLASELLDYPGAMLARAVAAGELIEVRSHVKKILKAVHETAKGLRKAGAMTAKTMHDFDVLCLPPVKSYTPSQIQRLRPRFRQ